MSFTQSNQYQPRYHLSRDRLQVSTASASTSSHFDYQTLLKGQSMEPENLHMEYKDYSYPWDNRKKNTLAECICAFLNTEGGAILIGIKETQQLQRIVKGCQYNEESLEQLQKDITSIVQRISRAAVANNLVHTKFIRVETPNQRNQRNRRQNQLYVVKITVQQGWLQNHQKIYNLSGECFFRTPNQVKSYTDDLDEIKSWRSAKMIEEKERQLELIASIRKDRQFFKSKTNQVSVQTDMMQVENQEQRSPGIRIKKVERFVQRVPKKEMSTREMIMSGLSRLWKKFTSICEDSSYERM